MLEKAKEWITWGEIDRETLIKLLTVRGRIPGNRELTDEYVNNKLRHLGVKDGIVGLADAILNGEVKLHKLSNIIKPVFRLSPPKGGFNGSIKLPFTQGGETGYRGLAINDLIKKML